ncbi:MAG: hypothetical protein Kow00121_39230 [Elainellaceae cyanobacterium]
MLPELNACASLAELETLRQQIAELEAQNRSLLQEKQVVEERVAELEKTNEVLQQSLNSLATEPNLEKFLGQVLGAIATQFNSPLAEYWYHPEGDTAWIGMMSWNGQAYNRAEIAKLYPTHPGVDGVKVPPDVIHGETLQTRKKYFIIEDWLTHPFVKHVRWMPENGLYKEINVPMVFGDTCCGALIVRMSREQPITSQQISLAEVLANQATLAVQLTRLAEEAKQIAVAREQERSAQERSAELSKANQSLKRSLDQLSSDRDLNSFLSHILREALGTLDGVDAQIFLYNAETGLMSPSIGVSEMMEVVPAPGLVRNLSGINQPFPANVTPAWARMVEQRSPIYFDIERDAEHFWPGTIEWHRNQGHSGSVCMALMLGNEPLGMLGLAFERSHFTQAEFEFFQALAQQATLAIQLTRLAEEAKQAAIAREQEKAAQERAAELTKANQALKRSLDALTTNPELDSFISTVLIAISEQFDAEAVEFWGHRDARVAYPISLVVNGRTVSAAEMANHPWKDGVEIPPEMVDYVPLDRRTRHFIVEDSRTDAVTADYWLHGLYWYEPRGITLNTQLNIPLTLGGRSPGALAIYLPYNHQITDEQIEIGYALAHQLSLAVELTRLADQFKETALIDERNRMAQEIHDTLAQSFTGILIQLETLHQQNSDINCPILQRIQQLAKDGLVEARRSVRSLRPRELENSNLFTVLPQLVDRLSTKASFPIVLTLTGNPYPLPADTAGNLLRIAQEAIYNALKHAQPTTIRVELLYETETVMLSIEDDGQGFDLQQQILPLGFGIIGMQERAERIGGQFSLSSGIGKGTTITVIVATQPEIS